MGALSVLIAGLALFQSCQTEDRQSTFEQEQSAPVLAHGTPLEQRGRTARVSTEYRTVVKRLDRMLLRRGRRGHVIIPVQNGGAGLALLVGMPLLVEDCENEPAKLPSRTVGRLGVYAVPSGGTEQLAYFQPEGPEFRNGTVEVDGKQRWYGWDYARFGTDPKPTSRNLLLWYTDGARRRLRWTCVEYTLQERTKYGEQYAVQGHFYGSKAFPDEVDTID